MRVYDVSKPPRHWLMPDLWLGLAILFMIPSVILAFRGRVLSMIVLPVLVITNGTTLYLKRQTYKYQLEVRNGFHRRGTGIYYRTGAGGVPVAFRCSCSTCTQRAAEAATRAANPRRTDTPILGWRAFEIRLVLEQQKTSAKFMGFFGQNYDPLTPEEAVCKVGQKHVAPYPNCTCGYYLYKEFFALTGIQALYQASGRVAVHRDGYRAQRLTLIGITQESVSAYEAALLFPHYQSFLEEAVKILAPKIMPLKDLLRYQQAMTGKTG